MTLNDVILGKDSLDWINHSFHTYLLLQADCPADELAKKLPDFIRRYMGEQIGAAEMQFMPYLQPLTHIYLHSHLEFELEPNGDIRYVYMLLIIAFFILPFLNERSLTFMKQILSSYTVF